MTKEAAAKTTANEGFANYFNLFERGKSLF